MELLIVRHETGVKLPPQKFTIDLKALIANCDTHKLGIETIHENFRRLLINTKTESPIFRMELWWAWFDLDKTTLYIRWGDKGKPQIEIREVVA